MKHVARLGVVAALSLVCFGPAWAQPKPPEAFTREYQAGIDMFRLGKYDEARAHLEAARAIAPDLPGPHRFLAAVAAAENKWDECIAAARAAIAANPQSNEIGATRKLHDDCRAALGRTPFTGEYADGGAIAVTANVSGATVTVGGLKYGATPLSPRAIALGEVEVLVQKSGWQDARTKVKILPSVVTDVELTLTEDTTPTTPVDGGPDPSLPPPIPDLGWLKLSSVEGARVTIDGQPATVDARGRYPLPPGEHEVEVSAPDHYPARRTVRISRGQQALVELPLVSRTTIDARRRKGHVAIATAAGLGAVGAVTGLLASRAQDRARDWWTIEATRPTVISLEESAAIAPIHTRADIEAEVDRAKTYALVSNLGYGLAAVSFGLGVYWLARSPDEPPPASLAPMIPGAAGGAWGVSVGGRL